MVDAHHLDALVTELAQGIGGDNGGHPGGRHDAVDVVRVGRQIGVDFFLRRLRRVNIRDHLHHLHVGPSFLGCALHRIDAQLGVGVDEEAGEMRDAAFAAHGLDQFLSAEIRGVAGVRPKAEGRLCRLLEAAGERNDWGAVFGEFGHRAVRADRIARKDEKRVVVLTQKALEQLILLAELPFLRNPIVGRSEVEVLLGVLAGLLPGGEIRMRSAGHERDMGRRVGRGGQGQDAERRRGQYGRLYRTETRNHWHSSKSFFGRRTVGPDHAGIASQRPTSLA